MEQVNYDKLREMIARCEWTFAKTMPWCPHEYIVRGKCPLTDEEFLYFVDMQRRFGIPEHWENNNFPYLHIDDYKECNHTMKVYEEDFQDNVMERIYVD